MTAVEALARLRGGLVVSCQAPPGSPLHDAYVVARMALAAEQGGAVGVRIDSPEHIQAVSALCRVPIVGLHKQMHAGSEVYITPTVASAQGVVQAGATLVAVDGTHRPRPGGETLAAVVEAARNAEAAVIADVSTLEEGLAALDLGVDALATTLAGYTAYTTADGGPDLTLVAQLARRVHVPVVCEGRVRSADDVRHAFDAGAFAVVVGGAITGIDIRVRDFVRATPLSGGAARHA